MSLTAKLLTLLVVIGAALLGFYLLDVIKGLLWLLFLLIAYPVIASFLSSLLDGTQFTPKELQELYASSLRSLPFITKLFPSRKD
jgi:hypothetical protein